MPITLSDLRADRAELARLRADVVRLCDLVDTLLAALTAQAARTQAVAEETAANLTHDRLTEAGNG